MLNAAIVYFSQEGSTHQLASAVKTGMEQRGDISCLMHRLQGCDIVNGRYTDRSVLELIDECQAVVFGSPTYMGGPAAQFKAFADASSERWEKQVWSGKLAAGFTCGSSPSGDQLATLQYFNILASQHGMFWVNLDIVNAQDELSRNRLGAQLGSTAWVTEEPIHPSDMATAEYLGWRVAETLHQLRSLKIPSV